MISPLSTIRSGRSRVRSLLLLLLLAAVTVMVVQVSSQRLLEAEVLKMEPVSIARARLEHRDGRFFRNGSARAFTGWMTDHFEDGKVRLRSSVVRGLLHGVSEGVFANGTNQLKEHFYLGLPHGVRTTWHLNGQKRTEGELLTGLQQGLFQQWQEDGKLVAEANFKDGKPHGISRAWHPSGFLKAEALMDKGEIISRKSYPDGVQKEPTIQVEFTKSLSFSSIP